MSSSPGKLRVAFLTSRGAFYSPIVLREPLGSPVLSVQAIYLHGSRKHHGAQRMLRRVARESGWRYAWARSVALMKSRLWRQPLPSLSEVAAESRTPVIPIVSANGRAFRERLRRADVEVLVSVFSSQILKPRTYGIPRLGTLNVHPALLPGLAGSHPIYWSLVEGLDETGITVHVIDQNVDTGPIVQQARVPIDGADTLHRLYTRVAEVGSALLCKSLEGIASTGVVQAHPQQGSSSFRGRPTAESFARFRRRGRRLV